MASSLREILTKNASNLSFEELYRTTYQLVLLGRGTTFYERVCELEQDWLKKDVQPRIADFITPNLVFGEEIFAPDQVNERREAAERFLGKMQGAWEDHQLCMGMITDVLMYMVSSILVLNLEFIASPMLMYLPGQGPSYVQRA